MTLTAGTATRWRAAAARHRPAPWWAVVAAVVGPASVAATVLHARGWYAIDNKSVFFFAPWRVVGDLHEPWDPRVDLGGPPGFYAPGIYLLTTALRAAGLEPWLTQRLFHALLLAVGGMGAAAVTHYFAPRLRSAHLTAALVYAFAPFSVTFLLPSWLYMNYALAPWFLLALLRGATGGGRWRWGAVFALALVISGVINPPGVVLAMVPLVPTAVYLVHVERRCRWRDVVAWAATAGLLSAAVLGPSILRFLASAEQLVANLEQSESIEAVSQSSSWAESWRGLGFWLSYWGEGGPALPQSTRYLTSPLLALLTFLPALVALGVLWRSAWRPRLLFAAMAIASLALMVGAYPIEDPSPLGRLLVATYERSTLLFAFRNSYKAGAGLMIALAVLCGVGAADALSRWRARRPGSRLPGLAVGLAVAAFVGASAAPFWTGSLYREVERAPTIPEHYRQAAAWLDAQPGDGRVLVLPLAVRSPYRWAEAPDFDPIQALLERSYLQRDILSQSGAPLTNLLDELAEWLVAGEVGPSLPPILERLGVRYVLVRNDLAWERVGAPRPAVVRQQVEGAGLVPVAAFGEPGDGVVAAHDEAAPPAEHALAPVEIYRVPGYAGIERAVTGAPALLVSGDGGAWASLADSGWLTAGGPVRYTGQLGPGDLAAELEAGSGVVVTDTNRRRAGGFGPASHTLPDGEARGAVGDLFARTGSQSVAVYGDARSIRAIAPPTLFPPGRSHRPAAAFDGDPTTAWLTGRMDPEPLHALRVDMARPAEVSAARLVAALPADGTRRVSRAVLRFSHGDPVTVDFARQEAAVTFPPRVVDWVEVRIDAIVGFGTSPVGFSQIELPGLDLREFVRVPDDVTRLAAAGGPRVERLLDSAPLAFQLRRLRGGLADEEAALRRELSVPGHARRFEVRGALSLAPTLDDQHLAGLVDAPVRAHGSARYPRDLAGAGIFAVDGRLDTGWSAPPEAGAALSLSFPERAVRSVEVVLEAGEAVTDVREVEVAVGDAPPVRAAPADDGEACPGDAPGAPLRRCVVVTARLPAPEVASSAVLSLVDLAPLPPRGHAPPARVLEVRVDGAENDPPPPTLQAGCLHAGPVIGGTPAQVRLLGRLDEALAGRSIAFEGCEPVILGPGRHRVEAPLGVRLDHLTLSTDPRPAFGAEAVSTPLRQPERSAPGTPAAGGATQALVVAGRAYSPRWRAELDGQPLGPAAPYDLQAGWAVPAGASPSRVAIELAGASAYRVSVAVSVLGVLACLVLLVRNPTAPARALVPRHDGAAGRASWPLGERRARRRRRSRARAVAGTLAVGAAFLIAGPSGAALATAGVLVALPRPDAARLIAAGALALLALAAVLTVPPLGPEMAPTPTFPAERELAHAFARTAAVLVAVAVAALAVAERQPSADPPPR